MQPTKASIALSFSLVFIALLAYGYRITSNPFAVFLIVAVGAFLWLILMAVAIQFPKE